MAQFTFRLEQVLQYRKQLEEQAMQALALATQHRDRLLSQLEQLEYAILEQRLVLSQPEKLASAERWLVQEYEKALLVDLASVHKQLEAAEDQVDACRVDLRKKAQERNLLDTLKEKQAARFTLEERQKEQRVYDETATLRFTSTPF